MSFTCKSFGCDNKVTPPESDFCNHCLYVHSILGMEAPIEEQVEIEEFALDTYAVHHAFNIQDPSGCLQRASRLILLSGQMNDEAETPKGVDIVEARNMLTRWLQLNEFEI